MRLKFGMSELGVRRWFTFFGSAVETVAIAGFGLAQSASAASLMYCLMKAGQSFHSSGFTANYVEVGGPDNGVLQGVGNTAATFPGFLLPILGSYVMSKTGSYTPMCAPLPPSSPRVPGYGES